VRYKNILKLGKIMQHQGG